MNRRVVLELWPRLADALGGRMREPATPGANLQDWTEWAVSAESEESVGKYFRTAYAALEGIGYTIAHLVYGCMSDCLGETGEKIKAMLPPVQEPCGGGSYYCKCPLSNHDFGKYLLEHAEELGLEFVFRTRSGGCVVSSRPLTIEAIDTVTDEDVTYFG